MNAVAFEKWKEQMIGVAKASKTPVSATFELTPRCNLDCKMCYVHNQNSNAMKDRELSTQTWKHVFDEAYDCGLMFATLTGGECLLRQDFKELYLHLWKKRVYMTVFTNGILLNEDLVDFFKQYRPQKVQISLYGSGEEGYMKVTGHRGFEKAFWAIRSLMAAGINVQIALTPSSYMKDDYISTLQFCRENGFAYKPGEFVLIQSRDDFSKDDHYLSVDEIISLATQRASLTKPVTAPTRAVPPCGGTCTEAPKGLVCNAGKTSLVVSWDGRMCLCISVPISKASILDMSYAEAWEKTKEAAQEILLGAECVGCPYDKVCPTCPPMRLTGLYTGHCNPMVCEVTKRLVAAGVKKLPEEHNDK